MEKEEFEELIKSCPLTVRMNDGREYYIEKPEFVTIGDYTASILFRNNQGSLIHGIASLINISTVLPSSNQVEKESSTPE